MDNNLCNYEAEGAVIGSILIDPECFPAVDKIITSTSLPNATAFHLEAHRNIYLCIKELLTKGEPADPITISNALEVKGQLDMVGGMSKLIDMISLTPSAVAVIGYAKIVRDMAFRRRGLVLLGQGGKGLYDGEAAVDKTLRDTFAEFQALFAEYSEYETAPVQNPAIDLRQARGWSTRSGIPALDRLMRFPSGQIISIAGDPGSGKTSFVIDSAAYNAANGNEVHIFSTENDDLELRMGMLTRLELLTSGVASNLQYDSGFRTPSRIDEVEELWDTHIGKIPLYIHRVTDGPDQLLQGLASIGERSVVYIDHLFAVIGQREETKTSVAAHESFTKVLANIKYMSERRNLIPFVFNQFKLSERASKKNFERGPDAQYGGSGIQNVASIIIHFWKSDFSQDNERLIQIEAKVWKVRDRMVIDIDDQGRETTVNPVGRQVNWYIDTHFRKLRERGVVSPTPTVNADWTSIL